MLEFDRASHTYRLDGIQVPNVTLVTDALSSYYGVPADVLQRKAEIGDAVHYATELDDQGDLDDESLPSEIVGYVNAWRQFKSDTGWVTQASEVRVCSKKFLYAGTLDAVGRFYRHKRISPKALALVDKKCTFTIMPAVGPQTSAYMNAWNEDANPSDRIKYRAAVQLKPSGDYVLHECSDPTDFSVFLSSLTLVNWRARHGTTQ